MKRILLPIVIILPFLGGCEFFDNGNGLGLNDSTIVAGLKTALGVGTDSSSTSLSFQDGYYGNSLVKIPLPEEAIKVQNDIHAILSLAPSLSSYLNLDAQFENVVKSINRAAEESAKDAAPIFKNAITDLSITKGLQILQGQVPDDSSSTKSGEFDSTAATRYLKNHTYLDLTGLYAPKIDNALDKDLGLGFSANQAWATLRTNYNNAVNSINGNWAASTALSLTGYSITTLKTQSIGTFATQKALDGLFLKVGQQEISIRRDPWKWITTVVGDILTKVFGNQQ
jgi:hypothetical protein